jgi:hypothetical protein
MPAGFHPHRHYVGDGKAGPQDQEDDVHFLFALIAREVREQQLARAVHKIFSHSIKVLFNNGII